MKLSCSSWSFHRTFEQGKINQLEWIEKCAKDLMLDGIELLDEHFRSTEKAYLRDLNKFTTDLGLTIACVSVSNNFRKSQSSCFHNIGRRSTQNLKGSWL